jgi:hypothetical protein
LGESKNPVGYSGNKVQDRCLLALDQFVSRVTQTGEKLANEIFTWEVILLERAIATKLDK